MIDERLTLGVADFILGFSTTSAEEKVVNEK